MSLPQYEALNKRATSSSYNTIASGDTTNTKGTWTLLGTTTFDYTNVLLTIGRSDSNRELLVDIGIGDTPVPIMENLFIQIAGIYHSMDTFYLPLFIPRLTNVWCRIQASGSTCNTIIGLVGKSENFSGRSYRNAVGLGVNTTNTTGTDIDSGGTANTKSSWVTLDTATRDYDHIQVSLGNRSFPTAPSTNSMLFDIGVGPDSTPSYIVPDMYAQCPAQTGAVCATNNVGILQLPLRRGHYLKARSQSSTLATPSRILVLSALGFYNPIPASGGAYRRRSLIRS